MLKTGYTIASRAELAYWFRVIQRGAANWRTLPTPVIQVWGNAAYNHAGWIARLLEDRRGWPTKAALQTTLRESSEDWALGTTQPIPWSAPPARRASSWTARRFPAWT